MKINLLLLSICLFFLFSLTSPILALDLTEFKVLAADGDSSDYFGYSVSISGETAIVGAPYDDDKGNDSGSAYVYVRNGDQWVEQAKLTASDGAYDDNFGWTVSISGETAIVGARHDNDKGRRSGSAYFFFSKGD